MEEIPCSPAGSALNAYGLLIAQLKQWKKMTRKEHVAECARAYLKRLKLIAMANFYKNTDMNVGLKDFVSHYNKENKTDLTPDEVDAYTVWT